MASGVVDEDAFVDDVEQIVRLLEALVDRLWRLVRKRKKRGTDVLQDDGC
jgi:hypothetical protein